MFTTKTLSKISILLVLLASVVPVFAQSIGSVGPASTPSQNYAAPHGGPSLIFLIAFWGMFAVAAGAILRYEANRPQR